MNYLVAVDDCFLDVPAGMGRVAWDIALEMTRRGHDVAMLCAMPRGAQSPPSVSESDGIHVVRYNPPVLAFWHPGRLSRLIEAAASTAREHLGSRQWDVIHIHSPFTGAGAMMAFGRGPRYVYTVHSPVVLEQRVNWSSQGFKGRLKLAFGQGALRRIEGRLLFSCAGIQALSCFTRDNLDRLYGVGTRVTVVPHWNRESATPHCTKATARERLGWPSGMPVLFTIRRHGPRYGLDIAIRAIAPLVREGRCRFVVAGIGPLTPSLKTLAADLGVGEGISFPGRLSDEDLNLAYQGADLFVLPTVALECFGLIIIEALSYGCPVLSTDVGSIPELMRPVLPDFIVPGGNVEALREKMTAFLDGKLVPPSPQALIEHVDRTWSKEQVVPRLLELLTGGKG